MDTIERTDAHQRLNEIDRRLRPSEGRQWALDRLDEMFRGGRAPDPVPDGFCRGRLVTMSVSGPSDALVRRIADLYMPWLGKGFDASTSMGYNVLKPNAAKPMRALWPRYEPERVFGDRLEVFPFRTRIAPGAVDPDVDVLKIDYDFEANPKFIIRRILDELVEVEEGVYLGKILYRARDRWHPIGFFTLER